MKSVFSHIQLERMDNGAPRIRYSSGGTIYDELFVSGKLISRYWSVNGQIVPEMHLGRDDSALNSDKFPMQAFHLGIDGEELSGGWKWVSAGRGNDTTGLRDESGTA